MQETLRKKCPVACLCTLKSQVKKKMLHMLSFKDELL